MYMCMCILHGGCVHVYTHIRTYHSGTTLRQDTHIMHILPQVGWIHTHFRTLIHSPHTLHVGRMHTCIYHPLDKTHTTLYVHTFYVEQIPQCPANTPPLAHKPPLHFQRKLVLRYFYPAHKPPPPPPPPPPKKTHPAVEILRLFVFTYATWLSTVKVSTANANRLHQRWTRQLLRGSTLLPRPSMLKLFSLPVASGASFRLALGPHPPPTMGSCFIGTGRGGVIAREIITSHVQAPPPFCSEAKVAKGGGGGGGGVFAGHYGTYTYHYTL